MNAGTSPGARLRAALGEERPLQLAGVINAYCALLAEHAGFRALYLSGGGVANASLGLPDLGLTGLGDVLTDVRRITAATSLPLLVDADTGFGGELMIERAVRELEAAGAAGLHLEDQLAPKRCGHRPGKQLVDAEAMCRRLRAATAARGDPDFVIMARTDALAGEGLEATVRRCRQYCAAGADMIFAEAVTGLDQYRTLCAELDAPVLANITEFGRTPLFTRDELAAVGVAMALYPLSAFRAMSAAAEQVYATLRHSGSQADLLGAMQTREELYRHLDYYAYEKRLDPDDDS